VRELVYVHTAVVANCTFAKFVLIPYNFSEVDYCICYSSCTVHVAFYVNQPNVVLRSDKGISAYNTPLISLSSMRGLTDHIFSANRRPSLSACF